MKIRRNVCKVFRLCLVHTKHSLNINYYSNMWKIGLKFVNTMREVLDIVIVTCEIVVDRMLKLKCVTSKNLPPNELPRIL